MDFASKSPVDSINIILTWNILGRVLYMLEIAHLLLSILRAPTPGHTHIAKYSSLAKLDGTQVSRLLRLEHPRRVHGC